MGKRRVKIFGERRTGTTAIIRMLKKSPRVDLGSGQGIWRHVDRANQIASRFDPPWAGLHRDAALDDLYARADLMGAWKHQRLSYDPAFRERDISVILTVRNPYAWVVSLYQRPFHMIGPEAVTLEAFIRRPWATVRRDHLDAILETPLDLWSLKLAAALEFADRARANGVRVAFVAFEPFLQDPAATLGAALAELEIDAEGVAGIPDPVMGTGTMTDRRHFESERLWLNDLTPGAITAINERLDWAVADRFGYARIAPEEGRGKPGRGASTGLLRRLRRWRG